MSTKIITGAYPNGYTLGAASRTLSLTATGYVGGTGVSTVVPSTLVYSVINDGLISEAQGNLANAVYLYDGGKVTNGSATDETAEIEGWRGIRMETGSGLVTNFGTILGEGRSGILFEAGGTVVNGSGKDRTALIEGGTAGVGITGYAVVSNFATIIGEVLLRGGGGGTITNGSPTDTVATILTVSEDNGVQIGPVGSVSNFGTIGDRLTTYYGVLLEGAGLTNGSSTDATALIYGHGGVEATVSASIENFGTIEGVGGDGAILTAGVRLTNGASGAARGLIEGSVGVYASGADALVVNYGTLRGSTNSVRFTSSGDELIVEAGSSFVGAIAGGGGTLVLSGGAVTITDLGASGALSGSTTASFAGFGAYVTGAAGAWTLAGTDGLATGQSLTDKGALTVTGMLTEAAGASLSVAVGGTVTFENGGGGVFSGSIAGAGAIDLEPGSDIFDGTTISGVDLSTRAVTLTLEGAIDNSTTIHVNGGLVAVAGGGATLSGGGTLALSTNPANRIEGGILTNDAILQGAGLIDLAGLANSGTILGDTADALSIDTGDATLANSGMIENDSTGGLVIEGAVANTGTLLVTLGALTVEGSLTGPGEVKVSGGAIANLAGGFSGDIVFTSTGGDLVLGHSRTDTVTVSGFAKTAITSIDLQDIAFAGAAVSYTGTTASGVLTVKSGSEVASITLKGDYLGSTFTLSEDSGGGTIVTDPPAATASALVSAMAGFGTSSASLQAPTLADAPFPVIGLTRPR